MKLTSDVFLMCHLEASAQNMSIVEFLETYHAYLSDDEKINDQWPLPMSNEFASHIIFKEPKFKTMFMLKYSNKII